MIEKFLSFLGVKDVENAGFFNSLLLEKSSIFDKFIFLWVKYSSYEKVIIDDETYIMPSKDAKPEVYNPFFDADEIICDMLNIASMYKNKYQHSSDSKEKKEESILQFINKYGLPGNVTYATIDADILSNTNAKIKDINNYQNSVIPFNDLETIFYLRYFFPDKNMVEFKENKGKIVIKENDNKINPNEKLKLSSEHGLVFSRNYCERFEFIYQYACDLYSVFNMLKTYNDDIPCDKEYKDRELKKFSARNIKFEFEYFSNEFWVNCSSNSLLNILDYIFMIKMTDSNMPLKSCKHCGKIYTTSDSRSEYCSFKCRNQANVYRSREKNKSLK